MESRREKSESESLASLLSPLFRFRFRGRIFRGRQVSTSVIVGCNLERGNKLEIQGCFLIRTWFRGRESHRVPFITRRYSISLAIKRLLIHVCMHPAVSRFSHKHLICNNEDGRSVSNRGNSGGRKIYTQFGNFGSIFLTNFNQSNKLCVVISQKRK